jgi:hypothetical protein
MTKKTLIAPKNPEAFAGVGGAIYFNPNPGRSNELKRDRNHEVPYALCSKVEKAKRVLRLQPKQLCDEALLKQLNDARRAQNPETELVTLDDAVKQARERLIESIELTAQEYSQAKSEVSIEQTAQADAVATTASAATASNKKGGK